MTLAGGGVITISWLGAAGVTLIESMVTGGKPPAETSKRVAAGPGEHQRGERRHSAAGCRHGLTAQGRAARSGRDRNAHIAEEQLPGCRTDHSHRQSGRSRRPRSGCRGARSPRSALPAQAGVTVMALVAVRNAPLETSSV